MKIAVISDIHSNFTYLRKIEEDVLKGTDSILFLGDAVGYYDQPNEVVDWLRVNKVLCVKGNHEKYLLGEIDYSESKERFYRIKEQRSRISTVNMDWISSWPDFRDLNLDGLDIHMSHSGFGDCEKYCRTNLDLVREDVCRYDYFLMGHTHVQWLEYYYGTCVLNPGSIGQPRDYTQASSFAVIDTEDGFVRLHKKKMNDLEYVEKLKSNNYDQKVYEILLRKKI